MYLQENHNSNNYFMKKQFVIIFFTIALPYTMFSQIAGSYWKSDANGINYKDKKNFGNIGIGTKSVPNTAIKVLQRNLSGQGSAAMDIVSEDNWQTVIRFRNITSKQEFQFNLAGSNNWDHGPKNFGIFNATENSWIFSADGRTSYLGIGSYSHRAPEPKSRLHIFNGDVNIEDIGSGIIMKSPNGKCWRVTVDNNGNLVSNAIDCPE